MMVGCWALMCCSPGVSFGHISEGLRVATVRYEGSAAARRPASLDAATILVDRLHALGPTLSHRTQQRPPQLKRSWISSAACWRFAATVAACEAAKRARGSLRLVGSTASIVDTLLPSVYFHASATTE